MRAARGWGDLSLRTRLVIFALGLVTLPGIAFALIAFRGTRAALERAVALQLRETAERGSEAVVAAVEHARTDARAWASHDLMRELLIGDLDKRVSRFLRAVRADGATYDQVLCADRDGRVVAAASGDWIGRDLGAGPVRRAWRDGVEVLAGPRREAGDRRVLELAVPIANPDPPGERIGALILVVDWGAVDGLLDDLRVKLASLGTRVAALVVDGDGHVVGGVSYDGRPAVAAGLAARRWPSSAAGGASDDALLAGVAPVAGLGWSVVIVEPRDAALAPVARMRRQWTVVLMGLMAVGLAVAMALARQVSRPIEEVTRATSELAADPERALRSLPVHSRDEVGQLTESFNRMTAELTRSRDQALAAAKFAVAGELAAMVAHQVRTPLSVMRSSAQMLADPTRGQAGEQRELVATIVAEVDRVEQVVGGLIELARPREPHPEPTDLGALLRRAAAFAAAYAEGRRIRLRCETDVLHPPALCDAEQIYQVILNLLVNAMQAVPAGGTVTLRALPAAAGLVGFAVEDDGPGLPPEIRDRLFRPFATGRVDGTGLGLAFVHRVVTAHRGSVGVDSTPGRGSVFEVKLPLAEEPCSES